VRERAVGLGTVVIEYYKTVVHQNNGCTNDRTNEQTNE
jgi:hypothetical protein